MTTMRDWEPGDGATCTYSRMSSLPCGRPVKTRIISFTGQGQMNGRKVTQRRPVCANHASPAPTRPGEKPKTINAAARRMAIERLISDHWDEFHKHLDEYVTSLAEQAAREAS